MLIRSLLLVVTFGAAGTAFAAGSARLDAFLSGLDTLEARFEQTLYDEQLNKLEQSEGTFHLRRPNQFRWDYQKPETQLIVADGEQVWMYDRELQQVTVRPIDAALGATPAMLLSSGEPVEKNFQVSDAAPSRGMEWVHLVPRQQDSGFAHIRIGFEGDVLRLMELTDTFGQLTRLVFRDLKRNINIGSRTFRFVPPDGVDVIHGG